MCFSFIKFKIPLNAVLRKWIISFKFHKFIRIYVQIYNTFAVVLYDVHIHNWKNRLYWRICLTADDNLKYATPSHYTQFSPNQCPPFPCRFSLDVWIYEGLPTSQPRRPDISGSQPYNRATSCPISQGASSACWTSPSPPVISLTLIPAATAFSPSPHYPESPTSWVSPSTPTHTFPSTVVVLLLTAAIPCPFNTTRSCTQTSQTLRFRFL